MTRSYAEAFESLAAAAERWVHAAKVRHVGIELPAGPDDARAFASLCAARYELARHTGGAEANATAAELVDEFAGAVLR